MSLAGFTGAVERATRESQLPCAHATATRVACRGGKGGMVERSTKPAVAWLVTDHCAARPLHEPRSPLC